MIVNLVIATLVLFAFLYFVFYIYVVLRTEYLLMVIYKQYGPDEAYKCRSFSTEECCYGYNYTSLKILERKVK